MSLPCLLLPSSRQPAPCPASTELSLLLGEVAKVLNTAHSCWFGVVSIGIVLPLLSLHQQKFILHRTRLVAEGV